MRLKKVHLVLISLALIAIALSFSLWRAPHWIKDYLAELIQAQGFEVMELSEPHLTWRGIVFDTISVSKKDSAQTISIAAKDLKTAIDWQQQRVSALMINALQVRVTETSRSKSSDWPTITLPELPIERIDVKSVSFAYDSDTSFQWQGKLSFVPTKTQWSIALENEHQHIELNANAPTASHLTIKYLENNGNAAVTLQLPSELKENASVQFTAQAQSTLINQHLKIYEVTTEGDTHIEGSIRLGANNGEWNSITATLRNESFSVRQAQRELWLPIQLELMATPNLISATWPAQTKGRLIDHSIADISDIAFIFNEPLQLEVPLQDEIEDIDAGDAWQAHIRGKIAASLSYQNVAINLSTTIDHDLNPSLTKLKIPVEFQAQGAEWRFSDIAFNTLSAQGNAAVLLEKNAATQADTRMSLQWKALNYQTYQVAPQTLQVNARFSLPTDTTPMLAQIKATAPNLKIQDVDTHYTLNAPDVFFNQLASQVRFEMTAAEASMASDGVMQSLEQLEIKTSAKEMAGLTRHLQINGKRLKHPSLTDWPNPDLTLIASEVKKNHWTAKGALSLTGKTLMKFDGKHALTQNQGDAELQWQWPLTDLQGMLTKKPKALAPLAFMSGESHGKFKVSWIKENDQWTLKLMGVSDTSDGALVWQESSGSGLAIHASVDDLLAMKGRVKTSMAAFALAAGINATELNAEIARTDDALALNNIYWKLLDAEWFVPNQQFAAEQTIHAPVAIIGLNLEKLLKLIDVHGLNGQGTLDGAIPLTLINNGLIMEDAELHAREPGKISYAPGAPDPNENIGLKVLRDFHYKTLRVQFNYRSEGDYTLKLTLHGSNPSFYDGYPINLTMNIQGQLPGFFKSALFSGDFNKHILQSIGSGTAPESNLR